MDAILAHIAAGVDVGVDISAAKLIDGLLGVSYHQQPAVAALRPSRIDAGKYPILDLVRVLKLIDHGDGPALRQ